MQIEKHLFRISERTLSSPDCSCIVKFLLLMSNLLALYYIALLAIGHIVVIPNNDHLSKCLAASSSFKFISDQLHMIRRDLLTPADLSYYQQQEQVLSENDQCTIIRDLNDTGLEDIYNHIQFAFESRILFLTPKERQLMNFHNVTIFLKQANTATVFIYGLFNLIMNELVADPHGAIPRTTTFINYQQTGIAFQPSQSPTLLVKLTDCLQLLLYYVLISVMTSLYIYGTIITAPALILLVLQCTNYLRNDNLNDVYRLFPWLGIHALVRQSAQNDEIKRSPIQVYKSFLIYFVSLYAVYYSIVVWVANGIFSQGIDGGIGEIMFGYIALIQFGCIVYMRTRTFLKCFPVLHTLLFLMLLFYIKFEEIGFKKCAYFSVSFTSFSLFLWMILTLEMPAQREWDRTKEFTPTIDRPRIGLFPLFNMSWMNNIPDQWSLLMPLFGRENFTLHQTAYVDRNFEDLQVALQPQ